MNKEEFKEIIVRQDSYFLREEDFIEREKIKEIEKLLDIPHVIIISGLRRIGKSTLLKQINKQFFDIIKYRYLNFEDEKLLDFEVNQFDKLYETFLELNSDKKIYFFDEIQNLESWEIVIRRLYEEKNKFFITGSNSNLLSKELGTKLTGRHIKIELFPFSFKEFLDFKKFSFNKNDLYLSENKAKVFGYFGEYIKKGGIPEYLKYEREETLKQVYEDIIYKDILVRYGITDEKSFKELSKYLLSNIGKEISYNNLKKVLGFGSSNTVKSYINYLENSYLIFELSKFDYSVKKQLINPKKIYSIDLAFVNLLSFQFSENIGRNLENLVFIELKRRGKEVYYHREKKECDFVVQEKGKITEAIQVSYNLEDLDTKKRELDGLIDAMITHNLEEGIILTYDEEYEIPNYEFRIKVIPIWKWLLEESN